MIVSRGYSVAPKADFVDVIKPLLRKSDFHRWIRVRKCLNDIVEHIGLSGDFLLKNLLGCIELMCKHVSA